MGFLSMKVLLVIAVFMLTACSSTNNSQALSKSSDQQVLREQLKRHYEIGEDYYKAHQFDLAEAEFKEMLSLRLEEEYALYRLGTIAFRKREFDVSADYFERAIRANPKNKKAHYNLANIRLMQAENHFKYYAALVDKNQDLTKVSKLVADIDDFNSRDRGAQNEGSLDALAGALKR